MNDKELATESLRHHEGFRAVVYSDADGASVKDPNGGHLTIGYGLNLEAGITQAEAEWLLQQRVNRAAEDAYDLFADAFRWADLGDERRAVLIEMAYQLGKNRLGKFIKFLDAARAGNHNVAANEMLSSAWAVQTPQRAKTLAERYRNA